ncbi:MAG: ExbD/TolR family protein [Limisphaerales bacterium]
MRFFIRKRRTAPAVIIVALVDVLIVLLIFLMVTTTFKQQATLRITLPESSQAITAGATNKPPFVVDIESNGVFQIGKLPLTPEQLHQRLSDEIQKNPEVRLVVNADRDAPWFRVVNVMDAAKELKFKSVSVSVQKKPAKQ